MKKEMTILESITPSLIEEIRDKVIDYLNPDKIILFGSVIKGNMKKSHDIDIYIIKRGIQNVREVERKVDELFTGRFFALDIIVRTPEQVEDSLRSGNSFLLQEIMAKGRVLYEKQ
ncbi:MAG: nucleotidyltransferase domain-containing protein [bacterium]|nr:nucleotidyltransferase domain-containing protein [bacterium]